jgi:hypothetical protein
MQHPRTEMIEITNGEGLAYFARYFHDTLLRTH